MPPSERDIAETRENEEREQIADCIARINSSPRLEPVEQEPLWWLAPVAWAVKLLAWMTAGKRR